MKISGFTRCAVVLWLAIAVALPANAQFWQKKEFQKWSSSECKELLRQSPWANEYKFAVVVIVTKITDRIDVAPPVDGRESEPHVTYNAQFWSAKPIRQAIVRLQQLDDIYKKLPADQKQMSDERGAQFLNMDFGDTIVIQLTTAQVYGLPLSRFWKSQSQEELKKQFVLIGAAGRFEPMRVVIQPGAGFGLAFQLIFARKPNGAPMVTPELKQMSLEIAHPGPSCGTRVPFVQGQRHDREWRADLLARDPPAERWRPEGRRYLEDRNSKNDNRYPRRSQEWLHYGGRHMDRRKQHVER